MSYNSILASAPLTTQNYHLKMIGTTIGNSLIWDNGTNVGIGNTNTSYTLDVSGTGRFTGAITGGSSITATGNIRSSNAGATVYTELQTDGIYATGANLYLYAPSTKDISLYAGDVQRMRITSAGNVGINGTNPTSKLHVFGIDSTTSSLADVWGSGVFRVTPRPNSSDATLMITNAGSTGVLGISAASSSTTALPLVLNPYGGFVGVNGATTPAAPITVYDQTSGSAGEQIRLCNSTGSGYWSIGRENNTTGDLYIGNGTLRAKIQPSGNLVLTRTTNSSIQAVGCYDDTTAGGSTLTVNSAGNFCRTPSSLRYKKDVETLDSSISESIYKMRPIWYRSISRHDRDDWSWYGLAAEEIAEIEPRLVQWGYKREDYFINEETGEQELKEGAELQADGVYYDKITVLLVAEMQKMNKLVQEQNQTIQSLQEQINILAK